MKVAELRATLNDVVRLLESAGLRVATISELREFSTVLERFQDQNLKSFCGLLARIDTEGKVAPKAAASKARNAVREPMDFGHALAEARFLYEHAADPRATPDRAAALFAGLPGFQKPQLVQIAAAIELRGIDKKTKPVIQGEIERRINDRIGATIRRQLLDRPEQPVNGSTMGRQLDVSDRSEGAG